MERTMTGSKRLSRKSFRTGAQLLAAAALLAWLPQAASADAASEAVTAATHANLAAAGKDIGTVHTHLHHTLNCLVGPKGEGFDKAAINPCANAGNGAIPDSKDAAKTKVLEDAATLARGGIAATDLAAAQKAAHETEAKLKTLK
jgi:hypothetical protein